MHTNKKCINEKYCMPHQSLGEVYYPSKVIIKLLKGEIRKFAKELKISSKQVIKFLERYE